MRSCKALHRVFITFVTICLWIIALACAPGKPKINNDEVSDSTSSESAVHVPYHPFRMTISNKSNWKLKVDSITSSEFDESQVEKYQEEEIDGDSLLSALALKFNDAIMLTDSCCVFRCQDQEVKTCQRRSGNERQWTAFKGIGYDQGYVIIVELGYETWEYSCFNPVTRQHFYTANRPHFINGDMVYAAGNYYMEGQVEILKPSENKYFGFDTFNWELTGSYLNKNSVYLQFSRRKEKKYLRVTFD